MAVDVSAFLEDTPDRAPILAAARRRAPPSSTLTNDADYLFPRATAYYAGASRGPPGEPDPVGDSSDDQHTRPHRYPARAPGDTAEQIVTRIPHLFRANYFVEGTRNSPLCPLFFPPGISSQNKGAYRVAFIPASPTLLRAPHSGVAPKLSRLLSSLYGHFLRPP